MSAAAQLVVATLLLALSLQGASAGPARRLQQGAGAASGKVAAPPLPPAARRRRLVLAAAGNDASWRGWLAGCEARSFDLALVYYGANPGFPSTACPECVAVWPRRGAKWHSLALLLQEPEAWALLRRYDAVMLADDDLLMGPADIDTAFAIFRDRRLELAQLSLCRRPRSETSWDIVYQRQGSLLRYTTFVEVMAPIVSASLLAQLRGGLLDDSYTGWGLDFLLPHVLGYSRDSIAVIDAACMVHPPRPPGQPQSRMYALSLPRTPQQEWEHVLLKHNASGGPGQREWGGVPLAGWRPAVATSQCAAAPPKDLAPLASLPIGSAAAWLAQAALMGCGGIALALWGWQALQRHAGEGTLGWARLGSSSSST